MAPLQGDDLRERTLRIGLALGGGDARLLDACRGALRDRAEVSLVPDVTALRPPIQIDVLVLVLHRPIEEGMWVFAGCRAANPQLPVLVLGEDLSADHAVELVKCGAADYLALPPDLGVLRRKIERVLLLRTGPAIEAPMFRALRPEPPRPEPVPAPAATQGQNRRRCFRAPIPPEHPASALLASATGDVSLTIEDISVPVGDTQGGMRLRLDPASVARAPVSSWGPGTTLSLRIQLAEERTPIPIKARIVRVSHAREPAVQGSVWLAVQYHAVDARHADRLQRYWILCQRYEQQIRQSI